MRVLLLRTSRDGYDVEQCGNSLTVRELKELLEYYDEDIPVYFSNDGGNTYGALDYNTLNSKEFVKGE